MDIKKISPQNIKKKTEVKNHKTHKTESFITPIFKQTESTKSNRYALQILRTENRTGVEIGRCLSPLIVIAIAIPPPPSLLLCTNFLLFNGETNLLANLDGENDLLNFPATDSFGEFLLAGLTGETERIGLFLIRGGDFVLIRNLCGVASRFLGMIGDFVLQNLWVLELGDEWNNGLGNRTVFLAHGRFLGDTLFTLFSIKFSLSISLLWRGEDTKSMRDLARWRDGEMDDRVDRDVTCFSLFLLARISEFSGFVGLWFF